jgi:energy-coupling factor transporter ATP-binding protein EcfA2
VYVNRMRLLNVKSLHGDIPDGGGPLPEPARRRLLLQGANGSGKSTTLETILTLWKFWGEWIEEGNGRYPPLEHFKHFLANTDLAAIEIVGIPNAPPLWIGIGKNHNEWVIVQNSHPEASFASLIVKSDPSMWEGIQLSPNDFLARNDFLALRHRSLAGSVSFPNIVYFPPEGRTIRSPEKPRAEIIDTTRFNWTAVYDPDVNLDSIMLTVLARTPKDFEECLRLVNLALEHRQKRITGFSQRTGRLVVEGRTESGISYQHPIEELSSGERQMLLLVGFVVAFLRPGGIVLIDEPDLHIHIAMVTQLLQTLEFVIQARNGQLIVASHSQLVWDWFSRKAERIELSSWRKERK